MWLAGGASNTQRMLMVGARHWAGEMFALVDVVVRGQTNEAEKLAVVQSSWSGGCGRDDDRELIMRGQDRRTESR